MDILQLAQNRERVFRITFPNGEVVPFRLLCWQDYKAFRGALDKNTIPRDIIIDRLLKRCILDLSLLEAFDKKPAGIPYTVAELVLTLSGPSANADIFNQTLELARQQIDSIDSQIVMIICRAFPAYKPEDILALKWPEIVVRLVQAERILTIRQELQEPLRMLTPEEIEEAKKPPKVNIDKLVRDGLPRENEIERPSGRELNPQQQRQVESVKALKQRQREMR